MKEILDKYKEICQVLFGDGIDDKLLIAKVYGKIYTSVNMLSSIFDSEKLILNDLYLILDIMRATIRHCTFVFPKTYDDDAATLTIAMLNLTRDVLESDTLKHVPIRELIDRDVVIELINVNLDTIIKLFNHDGPLDDSYLSEIGYNISDNTIIILYKALEKHMIHEHINIDISHRNDKT